MLMLVEVLLLQPALNPIQAQTNAPYVSYFGGSKQDIITVTRSLTNGNQIIGGYTLSDNLPVTPNCHQTLFGANRNWNAGFIACFDSLGRLSWCTYLGYGSTKINSGIVDGEGNIVVVGSGSDTSLSTINKETISQGTQFIAKFNPQGQMLWSSFLKGGYLGSEMAIVADVQSNYYVAVPFGVSNMMDFGFPDSIIPMGLNDIVITKIGKSGNILWNVPIIGNKEELLPKLAIKDSNIYIGFETNSDVFEIENFSGSFKGGGQNLVVLKLKTSGLVEWGRYLGNSSDNWLYGITVTNDEPVLLIGMSDTSTFNLNIKIQGFYSINSFSALFVKLTKEGIVKSAMYRPNASLVGSNNGLLNDLSGNIYQIGGCGPILSEFNDTNLFSKAFQPNYGGMSDIGIYVFNPEGKIIYFSYLGGSYDESPTSFDIQNRRILISGYDYGVSSDTNLTTPNAFQRTINGGRDGIIASFELPLFFPDIYYNTLQYENNNCKGSGSGKIIGSQPEGGNGVYTYSWLEANSLEGPYFLVAQLGKDFNITNPINSKWYKRVVISGSKIDTSEALFIGNVNKGSIGFKVNKLIQCQKGNNFEFEDTTINATSHLWNFDDGTFLTERKVSKTYDYSTKNYYQVKLINWNNGNCYDTLVKTIYLISNPELPSINGNAIVVRGETTKYAIDKKWNDKIEWQLKLGEGFIRNDTLIVRWLKSGLDTLLIYVTNAGGCLSDTLFFPVQVGSAIGKEDFKLGNELKLYPNPATSMVRLQLTGLAANAPMEVALYNVLGQAVIQEQTRYNGHNYELNLQDLNPGVYIVKLQAGGKVYTKNFVKE
jgi:hypothetical protein